MAQVCRPLLSIPKSLGNGLEKPFFAQGVLLDFKDRVFIAWRQDRFLCFTYCRSSCKESAMKKIGFFVALAFVLRIASIFILRQHINPDVWEYDRIALNLLSGKGYTYGYLSNRCFFFGYPFYPYFSAAIHFITNRNYLILEIVQALIAAFSVIPLTVIAKKIFNKRTAVVAGLLYCFHPGLIVYTGKIHELTLVLCFILVISYLMLCFEIKRRLLFIIGILIGLGILLRPTFIFFIPLFFIYLIVKKGIGIKKAILNSIIIALLAMIVISPWIYRGYKKYNRFIFITTTSAVNFWIGNNPMASGSALTRDNKPIFSIQDEAFRNKALSLNELDQHDFFKDESIKYIRAYPLEFFKRTLVKFIYFWSFSPQTGLRYPASWLIVYKFLYYFLAAFFILGLYFIFRNHLYINIPAVIFLLSFFLIISIVHSFYHVDGRYRWMIEPLLMVFSSYGIATLHKNKELIL